MARGAAPRDGVRHAAVKRLLGRWSTTPVHAGAPLPVNPLPGFRWLPRTDPSPRTVERCRPRRRSSSREPPRGTCWRATQQRRSGAWALVHPPAGRARYHWSLLRRASSSCEAAPPPRRRCPLPPYWTFRVAPAVRGPVHRRVSRRADPYLQTCRSKLGGADGRGVSLPAGVSDGGGAGVCCLRSLNFAQASRVLRLMPWWEVSTAHAPRGT